MWGNSRGWIISAVIAAAMVGLMYVISQAGAPSGMTARFAADPKNLDVIALNPGPETILPTMTDSCDAGDAYRAALAEFNQSPAAYTQFDSKSTDPQVALDKIVEGMHCKSLTLFSKTASEVINFERTKPPIEALKSLGEAAALKALVLLRSDKKEEAQKFADAAFALGFKMYNERVVFEEFETGLAIMSMADGAMKQIDPSRVAQITAFEKARIKYFNDKLFDLRKITKTIDGKISGERAGDVFALAEKSKERMWRVEACLQLARTHRFVGEEGRGSDQRKAQEVLVRLATDPDPVVRTAAIKARDITEQEYNRQ
jgi:hypothetical protein